MIGRILILGLLFCIKICPTLSPINEVKSKNHLTYAQTYYSEDGTFTVSLLTKCCTQAIS